MPYETEVLENAAPGTKIFDSIIVTDQDVVGENLNITCMSAPQNILIKSAHSLSPSLSKPSNAVTVDDTDSYEPCSK